MIVFDIQEELACLNQQGDTRKLLTVTSWNHAPAKLDLRSWRTEADGTVMPNKGLTLTDDEAETLLEALEKYLQ